MLRRRRLATFAAVALAASCGPLIPEIRNPSSTNGKPPEGQPDAASAPRPPFECGSDSSQVFLSLGDGRQELLKIETSNHETLTLDAGQTALLRMGFVASLSKQDLETTGKWKGKVFEDAYSLSLLAASQYAAAANDARAPSLSPFSFDLPVESSPGGIQYGHLQSPHTSLADPLEESKRQQRLQAAHSAEVIPPAGLYVVPPSISARWQLDTVESETTDLGRRVKRARDESRVNEVLVVTHTQTTLPPWRQLWAPATVTVTGSDAQTYRIVNRSLLALLVQNQDSHWDPPLDMYFAGDAMAERYRERLRSLGDDVVAGSSAPSRPMIVIGTAAKLEPCESMLEARFGEHFFCPPGDGRSGKESEFSWGNDVGFGDLGRMLTANPASDPCGDIFARPIWTNFGLGPGVDVVKKQLTDILTKVSWIYVDAVQKEGSGIVYGTTYPAYGDDGRPSTFKSKLYRSACDAEKIAGVGDVNLSSLHRFLFIAAHEFGHVVDCLAHQADGACVTSAETFVRNEGVATTIGSQLAECNSRRLRQEYVRAYNGEFLNRTSPSTPFERFLVEATYKDMVLARLADAPGAGYFRCSIEQLVSSQTKICSDAQRYWAAANGNPSTVALSSAVSAQTLGCRSSAN
jgi:hypothetical protein